MALAECPDANGEVFNVGSTEEVSILDLAHKIKGMAASESHIVLIPYEKAYKDGFEDMMRRVPDLNKISETIGYSPLINLDEILLSTINEHVAETGIAVQ